MPREAFTCYYDKDKNLYRKRIKDSSGKYISLYDRDKSALRKKYEEAKRNINASVQIGAGITVAEYAAKWFALNTAELSLSRKSDYKISINNHILPTIGHKKLQDVRLDDVKSILSNMSKMSHSSQVKTVTTLKRIFAAAEESMLLSRSPCASLKAGGYKSKEKVPLSNTQAQTLVDAVSSTSAYLFVMLGLYAGLRREEILGLNWDCVELGDIPYISVRRVLIFEGNRPVITENLKSANSEKNASKRDIPIPATLRVALSDAKQKSSSEFVCSDSKGNPRSRQSFKKMWSIVMARTIDDSEQLNSSPPKHPRIVRSINFYVSPHVLRHTYITNLVLSGMNIKKVQYLAGHANIQLTLDIYTKLMDNKPEDLFNDISAAFGDNFGANLTA